MSRLALLLFCFFIWSRAFTAINTEEILKKIDLFNSAGNTDSAAFYFSILQKELKEHPNFVCQIAYYDRQILYLIQIGHIERSMGYSDSILMLIGEVASANNTDSSYVAHAYSSTAGSKVTQFKYREAIELYRKAVNYSQTLKDKRYNPFFCKT